MSLFGYAETDPIAIGVGQRIAWGVAPRGRREPCEVEDHPQGTRAARLEDHAMIEVMEAPVELVEAMASLRFPPKADRHLQRLMDRNTEGRLSPEEKEQLETLVELSESLSLIRAQALQLLNRRPR
jgi:hypothetical protein